MLKNDQWKPWGAYKDPKMAKKAMSKNEEKYKFFLSKHLFMQKYSLSEVNETRNSKNI